MSVCIFSILLSIHFVRCLQGEVVYQSRASLVWDHLLHFCLFFLFDLGVFCEKKLDASHLRVRGNFSREEKKEEGKKEKRYFFSELKGGKIQSHHKQQ